MLGIDAAVEGTESDDFDTSGQRARLDTCDPSDVRLSQTAEYLLALKAESQLTQTAVDKVMDATSSLIASVLSTLKHQFRQKLETVENLQDQDQVMDLLEYCCKDDVFSNLGTRYKQETFFQEKFHFVVCTSNCKELHSLLSI